MVVLPSNKIVIKFPSTFIVKTAIRKIIRYGQTQRLPVIFIKGLDLIYNFAFQDSELPEQDVLEEEPSPGGVEQVGQADRHPDRLKTGR